MKALFTIALIACAITILPLIQCNAQLVVWTDDDTCALYHHALISHMPPVNPSMPWDVIVGYVAIDSMCRSNNRIGIKARAMIMSKDSLEMGLRYWFRMRDYDPLLAEEFYRTGDEWEDYSVTPSKLKGILTLAYYERFGSWDEVTSVLMGSDFILHARVISRTATVSKMKLFGLHVDNFCATVVPIRKIVGQTLLNACSNAGEEPYECMNVDWGRVVLSECFSAEDSMYSMMAGPDLMEPGKEYLLFLDIDRKARYDVNTGSAIVGQSGFLILKRWVLSVVDGNVIDSDNYYGLGTSVPIDEFVDYIYRKRHETIGL